MISFDSASGIGEHDHSRGAEDGLSRCGRGGDRGYLSDRSQRRIEAYLSVAGDLAGLSSGVLVTKSHQKYLLNRIIFD